MQSVGMAFVVTIAVGWVFLHARSVWRLDRLKCVCTHIRMHHVSALDWDSDYGDPQHTGMNYRKPGTCRLCKCRAFIRA